MKFEDLQKAWQSQPAATRVTIDSELLLQEVRRNQRQFRATIFWRDAREVGVSFLLTWYFIRRGWPTNDWTDCLVGLTCFGVGTFMLLDRFLQRRKTTGAQDSLVASLESSLQQVNHQIWLLKNVFWWYLLPLSGAIGISVVVSCWEVRHQASQLIFWGCYIIGCALLDWFLYWLNQIAVKNTLEPRRRELEALLAEINQTFHNAANNRSR